MSRDRHQAPVAVIDVETTGLFPGGHDRIVEIAIVRMDTDGRIAGEYESLVNPDRDMGPTSIHGISAAEVLHAPKFDAVAGDILQFLEGSRVIAGHNFSFDQRFISKEYERLGIAFPPVSVICTYKMLGRSSLRACCEEFKVSFDGAQHWALSDARATAQLVSVLFQQDPSLIEQTKGSANAWPPVPPLGTPTVTRRAVQEKLAEPPGFLQRIAERVHRDQETMPWNTLAYLALVDRVLEDRSLSHHEEEALVAAAVECSLTLSAVRAAHKSYLHSLAIAALADGKVTDAERRDLHEVARMLGETSSELDILLDQAARQLRAIAPASVQSNDLRGKTVCFTGELNCRLKGAFITRDVAEALAEEAGLFSSSGVTKALDLLVVADPNTQSGKAKKARTLGARILAETVFWNAIGVKID